MEKVKANVKESKNSATMFQEKYETILQTLLKAGTYDARTLHAAMYDVHRVRHSQLTIIFLFLTLQHKK